MNREEILANDLSWATKDEINAIDYIARSKNVIGYDDEKFKDITVTIPKSERKRKLRNYITTCHIRTNWGSINKMIAESYAQEILAKL